MSPFLEWKSVSGLISNGRGEVHPASLAMLSELQQQNRLADFPEAGHDHAAVAQTPAEPRKQRPELLLLDLAARSEPAEGCRHHSYPTDTG
jgi:hypothetical protein